MRNAINKKHYFTSFKLCVSDYFLFFGFLFFIPFAAFSWKFMVTSNPSLIFFNDQMIITCFTITAICLGFYFFFEAKQKRLKNEWFLWLFVFFTISSLVSVLIQPTNSIVHVTVKKIEELNKKIYPGIEIGDIITVTTHISSTHRLFFACSSILIPSIIFIILFILPKRINSIKFIVVITVIVSVFIICLTFYSYIFEFNKYRPFLKNMIAGNVEGMYAYAMTSFLVQRVPYGACLMMGLMFFLVSNSITKKWYWLLGVGYCFINMLFTWNKTGLAITFFILNIYVVINLIFTFKKNIKRNVIITIIYLLLLVGFASIILIALLSKGDILGSLYNLLSSFTEKKSILSRTYIWANIRQRLQGGWLIIGRGYGMHNYVLYPMNLVNGDDVCPSHSSYYAVLGAGGLIQLIGYLAMIIFYVFIFIKCIEKDKVLSFSLALPVFSFFLYSFTEGVNYLVITFMLPTILYYNLIKKQQENNV